MSVNGKADIYTRITNRIIADLEQGVRPWFKPWNAEHAAGRITKPLRHNGTPYKGINVIMLWSDAMAKGFTCPIWMTYKQAQEIGGQVRKGETGSMVVFADQITRTETTNAGEETEREIPFMKGYTVFNCEQIDGLPDQYRATAAPTLDPVSRIDHVERFFAATGADIRHGGNRAYYAIQPDYVQMPDFVTFRDAESYYATLAHEMTHWTRHPSRLNRDFGRKRWGDEELCRRGTGCRVGFRVSVGGVGHYAGGEERSRRLYRLLANGAEQRQAGDLHGGIPCPTGGGLPAQPATC